MPISDPTKRKEHDRLTKAILRAKKAGKDIRELVAQRQKLIGEKPKRSRTIKKTTKSREEINRNYYQRNKEWLSDQKKDKQEEKWEQEEEQRRKQVATAANQLIKGSNIMILLSFKEYTQLNRAKQELWKDFEWTLRDLVTEGIGNIIEIQNLELLAGNLVRDYYQTTKEESGIKNDWKILSEEQQERLINYWWRERVRIRNYAADELTDFAEHLRHYLATREEIELAKYHEERGKKDCKCYSCEERKKIRREVINQRKKIMADYEAKQRKSGELAEETEWVKADCYNCGEHKKVSVDSGICRKCKRELEKQEKD